MMALMASVTSAGSLVTTTSRVASRGMGHRSKRENRSFFSFFHQLELS